MKQLAILLCATALLAGCGTGMRPLAPAAMSAAAIEAAAAKAGTVSATKAAAAQKIIDADFIDKNFQKAPDGKGYWIPSPTDPDDGVEVKKVSSGFAKWKFTATADANVLNWAAEQTCFGQDMEEWKQNVTGTVNMKTRAVTYNFGGSK